MAKQNISTLNSIVKQYDKFHFSQIKTNRFTHRTFEEALQLFRANKLLTFNQIGVSEEGRVIHSIEFGKGPTKVLLWSQMHGNESTATRAILDILLFLTSDDEFNEFRSALNEKLTLRFVPMLNPDGTERFQRRTATEIDMNRDAVALQTPEARLLHDQVEQFKPEVAFNLHDQRRFYNVKGSGVPSSMSFLAPAYDHSRKVNDVRKRAMQLIAGINEVLQEFIPGGVGLYDDTYSHRSFGDYLQSKGVSTVLVESGWLANDMEKEKVRKLNFISLLKAFDMLVFKSYEKYSEESYKAIPAIDTKLFDVLLKNVGLMNSNSKMDIGINRTEHLLNHPDYYAVGSIDDLGDLSPFFGFDTIDATSLIVVPGKAQYLGSYEELSLVSVKRLLRQGVLFLVTDDIPLESHVAYPINIVHPRKLPYLQHPVFEGSANFLLVDKSKFVRYIVMNGFVFEPDKIREEANGLVTS